MLLVSGAVELEGLQRKAAGRNHGGRVYVVCFFSFCWLMVCLVVLLGLLILTAHLEICIHIYLYFGLPQIVQQAHTLFPRVGFLKPNQKSLFLTFVFSPYMQSKNCFQCLYNFGGLDRTGREVIRRNLKEKLVFLFHGSSMYHVILSLTPLNCQGNLGNQSRFLLFLFSNVKFCILLHCHE